MPDTSVGLGTRDHKDHLRMLPLAHVISDVTRSRSWPVWNSSGEARERQEEEKNPAVSKAKETNIHTPKTYTVCGVVTRASL
ncbi:hypothetical protein PoB_001386100 [Plakobranchus ocellatus]|uniref:Uncharacterized protein n=1 Tax=Plakobranchus ocellatus TaxID=259542 RepID=A0AAV3YYA5_9GAST|nr:hypothetical protein PoB_001386100 [Plakobranchus ocellatus]